MSDRWLIIIIGTLCGTLAGLAIWSIVSGPPPVGYFPYLMH